MTKALKYDDNKPRMELLDPYAMAEIAKVMAYGAKKYTKDGVPGEHNWRKGFAWSRLYGAALRHIMSHMNGDSTDPDTGSSHLAHAACCIMFLQWHEKNKPELDDRYKLEPTPATELISQLKSELALRFAVRDSTDEYLLGCFSTREAAIAYWRESIENGSAYIQEIE